MNFCFWNFFRREWSHFFSSKRYWLTFLIFLILSLLIVGSGSIKYHQMKGEIREFKQIEGEKNDSILNYKQLSYYGLRYLFIPTSFYAISNRGENHFFGYCDVLDRLHFYKSTKGENYFKSMGSYDFFDFLLFFGSILVLFYGYDSFRNPEGIRFFCSLLDFRKSFFYISFARICLLLLLSALLFFLVYFICSLSGIPLPFLYFLIFYVTWILLAGFLFFNGVLFSRFKNGVILIFTFLVISHIFLPYLAKSIVLMKPSGIKSEYATEAKKLHSLVEYVKESGKRYKSPNDASPETARKAVNLFYESTLKVFNSVEEDMKTDTHNKINSIDLICNFFPTTFFINSTKSLTGFNNASLSQWHDFMISEKTRFIKFCLTGMYLEGNKKPTPFIKANGNLYYSKPVLPPTSWLGFVISFFFILLSMFLSYKSIKRHLFIGTEHLDSYKLDFTPGKSNLILTNHPQLPVQFFQKLSSENKSFIYIPEPTGFDYGLKVSDFGNIAIDLNPVDKFCNLSDIDKFRVLLQFSLKSEKEIIFFHLFNYHIPVSILKNHLSSEARKDKIIFIFSNNPYLGTSTIFDSVIYQKTDPIFNTIQEELRSS
jgi:hypothetical protein